MTSKERIIAALEGQAVDHVPFSPFLAYVWESFPKNIRDRGQLAFHHAIGADPLWRGAACPVTASFPASVEIRTVETSDGRSTTETTTPVGILRSAYARSEAGNTAFLVEHPLKREEDFKIAMWLEENLRLNYNEGKVEEHFAGDGREGLSLGMLIPGCKSAFQGLVEHHVGTEELAYALADFPETVEALLEVTIRRNLEAVRMSAESRYEYFITWEDSSTQNYSPQQYGRYVAPEIAGWCKLLGDAGKKYIQHACGHARELLIPMKESGVFAVESLSPPPTGNVGIGEARRKMGSGVGIIGGIEPTKFLNLEEEELGEYVELTISEAKGGPFVLANSDSCPPGVTIGKFRMVSRIAGATPMQGFRR